MSRGYQHSKKPITVDEHARFGDELAKLSAVLLDMRVNTQDEWRNRFHWNSKQAKAVWKATTAIVELRRAMTGEAAAALRAAGRDESEAVGMYWPDMKAIRLTNLPVLTRS
jgi:ABC-type uncharacterized transport system YnjBCD substrate-binding protein